MLVEISVFQAVNIAIIFILLFLGFMYLESLWSFKLSKPFAWEAAIKNNLISKKLMQIERKYKDKVRLYNFWFQVERLRNDKILGAFAELGVHQGETAKILHLMDEERKFYLFDTFDGFTKEDMAQEAHADKRFTTTIFANTSEEEVIEYIKGNQNIQIRPGVFPSTADGLEAELFALVHIDADLYVPTIEALKFFYPRLNDGGVIIIHDYNHDWHGVPRAINEFIGSIPESLIEVPDWQGSAMIIKNSTKEML